MKISHATFLSSLLLLICNLSFAQTYYTLRSYPPQGPGFWEGSTSLYKITVNGSNCSLDSIATIMYPGVDSLVPQSLCHCPDGFLYADEWDDSTHIYKIDKATAVVVEKIAITGVLPSQSQYRSLSCGADGMIYVTGGYYVEPSKFMKINPLTGATTLLGTGPSIDFIANPIHFDNNWYGIAGNDVKRIDLNGATWETEVLFGQPFGNYIGGVSIYPSLCNTFISNHAGNLQLINIDDETFTPLCQLNFPVYELAGVDEYDPAPSWPVPIDLDRNDSSGAFGSDYNSAIFNCKTNHVKIADDDAFIPSYPIIDTMWVSITGGILDPGMEGLYMGLPPIGIGVAGNTTTTITFTNAAGNARVSDFLDALKLVQYKDIALSPTGGTREVTVSFTTRQGFPTNTAKCFVQVQQLPTITVDLGPDQIGCNGTGVTLDAGNPGKTYYWSGQQTSQTITTFFSGTYKVTVSDGINCPGSDEVMVSFLPVVQATVQMPNQSCAGDSIPVNITWNTNDAFDIVVIKSTSDNDTLYGFTSGSPYFLITPDINNLNAYTLTGSFKNLLTGNSIECLKFMPVNFSIQVHPTPEIYQTAKICEGDSIFLAGAWRYLAGDYIQYGYTSTACNQAVITTLTLKTPGNKFTYLNSATCNPAEAGVFTQHLYTQNICDSTVITTVNLLTSDTVFLASQTCDPTLAGVSTQDLINLAGCDSTVITSITLSPNDSVFLASQSCDPTLAGVFTETLTNQAGCDSTVITTVTLVTGDTVFFASQSCDPALTGVFTETLTNQTGCDSTIITTVTLVTGDTVFFASQSCDPALTGVFTETLTNQAGCDSTVITTITLVTGDTVLIASQSCDLTMAGVFTQNLTNQSGCDSTVITTITLIPGDMILLENETCDPALAGTDMVFLTNQYGCDSVVITTISLLPIDTTLLNNFTCEPSETGLFELHFTGLNGCDSLVLLTVSLLPADSCLTAPTLPKVYAPNAFSPNGDGVNDLFLLFGNDQIEKIRSLQIYSRWGERVFEAFNLLPNDPSGGWDGSFRGKPMGPGVFLFYSEVLYKNGEVEIVKGDVNLLK